MNQTIEEIFEAYYQNFDQLSRLAIGITGDHYLAEDAMQELAILIITKSALFVDAKNMRVYLSQALRNKSIDIYQANKKSAVADYPLDTLISESNRDLFSTLEDQELLDAIFKDCSPELKRAFYLHVVKGYSIEELANEMGITANTLSLRFARFRKKAGSLKMLLLILQFFSQLRQI